MSNGSTTLLERTVSKLATDQPADFRAMMRDPDWMRLGLAAFKTRLENAERDAVRLFFEAQGWVHGHETTLVLAFLGAHGVTSMEDAERYLRLGKTADGTTIEDARRVAVSTLRGLMRADPSERTRLMQELFGMSEVAA